MAYRAIINVSLRYLRCNVSVSHHEQHVHEIDFFLLEVWDFALGILFFYVAINVKLMLISSRKIKPLGCAISMQAVRFLFRDNAPRKMRAEFSISPDIVFYAAIDGLGLAAIGIIGRCDQTYS